MPRVQWRSRKTPGETGNSAETYKVGVGGHEERTAYTKVWRCVRETAGAEAVCRRRRRSWEAHRAWLALPRNLSSYKGCGKLWKEYKQRSE